MALGPGYHRVAPVVGPCHTVLLLVSVITGIYGRRLSALSPAPNLEDQGTTPSLVSILQSIWHGWPYQASKTSADIAIAMVIETHKPLHHDKVVI